MPIVLLGPTGQLGRELSAVIPAGEVVALPRTALDLTSSDAIAASLAPLRPTIVVNATAENRVDLIETDPAVAAIATAVNATAVGALAAACHALGAFFVHVGTDYVFDGTAAHPYTEADTPNPRSAYARSKLAGEVLTAAATPRHAILRVAGLYAHGGSRGKGGSFADKILAQARAGKPLKVVDDQITAPTWARDVAVAVARLLPRFVDGSAPPGVYHVTNAGSCSWHQFACAILQRAGIDAPIERLTTAALNAPAPRPAYSVLANDRLAAIGEPPLRSWDTALAEYIATDPAS